ncbi:magnesium transporter [Candidatus Sumerlaeota bacterium]|nr:magnesium transporter [Candidatus Sumerlaeota bacterium]
MAPGTNTSINRDQLGALITAGDGSALREFLEKLSTEERVYTILRLGREDIRKLFILLKPDYAAELMKEMPEPEMTGVVRSMPVADAAQIIDEMRSDRQADVLSGLDRNTTEAILNQMMSREVKMTRFLLSYPEDTAGGLMGVEYLNYNEHKTVLDVLLDLRQNGVRYSDYEVQYAYITGDDGTLCGVLKMRDLLFAAEDTRIDTLMLKKPVFVNATMPLDELSRFFDDHGFLGVPVVDGQGRLVGVIRRTAVKEASAKQANRIFLKLSGIVGGEELRSMPFFTRSGRRLGFLTMNIGLNLISASVVAVFQGTLEKWIALAIFLPIISDMSGCSGNQAVAVSIRELTLGLIKGGEFLRVLLKEAAVGLLNGIALGTFLGLVAWVWQGSAILGAVIGCALATNNLVAVCVGGLLPLFAKAIKLDPALVSGPLLTTITDMFGFFLALGSATMVLHYWPGLVK